MIFHVCFDFPLASCCRTQLWTSLKILACCHCWPTCWRPWLMLQSRGSMQGFMQGCRSGPWCRLLHRGAARPLQEPWSSSAATHCCAASAISDPKRLILYVYGVLGAFDAVHAGTDCCVKPSGWCGDNEASLGAAEQLQLFWR